VLSYYYSQQEKAKDVERALKDTDPDSLPILVCFDFNTSLASATILSRKSFLLL